MTKKTRRLLILGPSFRRSKVEGFLPAVERFEGIYFRVARKYLKELRDVDVFVMNYDLILVDGDTPLAYRVPEGEKWREQTFSEEVIVKANRKNENFVDEKLKHGRYSEIFVAMGKIYSAALPDFSKYDTKVIFPTSGGLGPKAGALKEWLVGS